MLQRLYSAWYSLTCHRTRGWLTGIFLWVQIALWSLALQKWAISFEIVKKSSGLKNIGCSTPPVRLIHRRVVDDVSIKMHEINGSVKRGRKQLIGTCYHIRLDSDHAVEFPIVWLNSLLENKCCRRKLHLLSSMIRL